MFGNLKIENEVSKDIRTFSHESEINKYFEATGKFKLPTSKYPQEFLTKASHKKGDIVGWNLNLYCSLVLSDWDRMWYVYLFNLPVALRCKQTRIQGWICEGGLKDIVQLTYSGLIWKYIPITSKYRTKLRTELASKLSRKLNFD